MNDIVETTGKLTEFGIVAILLFLLLSTVGGIWWLVISVYRRLFGSARTKEEGIVSRLVTKHELFLDSMATSTAKVAEATEENTRIAKNIETTTKQTDSTINKLMEFMRRHDIDIQSFRRVWKSHVRVLQKMADKIGVLPEIDDHLRQMESILDEPNGDSP